MRKLNCCDEEYNEEEFQFSREEDEDIEEYAEVLDCQLFAIFQDKFSPAPDNPYQLIFNRCIYDALNFILDDYRPFGTRGMPGICLKTIKPNIPSLQSLQNNLISKLSTVTQIKLGCLSHDNLRNPELNTESARSFNAWQRDAVGELQKEFSYNQEDDTI